jgi:hypothetical protein
MFPSIEHITILLLFILVSVVTMCFYSSLQQKKPTTTFTPSDVITVSSSDHSIYTPPLKMDSYPVMLPMQTQPSRSSFSQLGILTGGDQILPLMGRRVSRDRYNYYTMSTNGTINTKLPLQVNGKSGTSEYGCDELSGGERVKVSGFNDGFAVTMYDNGMFVYSP